MTWPGYAYAVARIAIVLTAGNVCAADPTAKTGAPTIALPAVSVSALRDPVEKSYRRMMAGLELFERRHGLAPGAPLRFKLLPRDRGTSMERITLAIVGDTVNIPVRVADDNTFALEKSRRALEENAAVIPNRKARSMTWRADIRTPGLPANTRRLGDLRLECAVGLEAGLVSDSPPSPLGGLIADRGYCEQRVPHYLFFADRPLWSVTLVYGNRREVLSVDDLYAGITRSPMAGSELRYCDCEVLLDRTYYAPLGDTGWPDDTLIELEYMDDGVAPAASGPAPARDGPP